MGKLARAAATAAAICLVTLCLLEFFSWVHLLQNPELASRADLYAVKREYLKGFARNESQDKAHGSMSFGKFSFGLRLHPYFGYTFDGDLWPVYSGFSKDESPCSINNFGFISLQKSDYPYVAQDDEFVIGVFGGSVGMQFYATPENHRMLSDALLPILKSKGYNRVTVLCFAIGAQKEPQALFILLYYLNTIDMAIFIEGANEVAHFGNYRDYPVEFPLMNIWPVLASKEHSPYLADRVGELKRSISLETNFTKSFFLPFARQSYFCHLVWQTGSSILQKRELALRAEIEEKARMSWSYNHILLSDYTNKEFADAYFQSYQRYVLSAHLAGREMGVPCFFVLQPSQYLTGSKALTPFELDKCYTPYDILRVYDKFNSYYPLLQAIYRSLAKEGVGTIDLTNIFAERRDSIYVDPAGHVNGVGIRMIGDAIIKQIRQKEDGLNIVPQASKRPWRLIRRD